MYKEKLLIIKVAKISFFTNMKVTKKIIGIIALAGIFMFVGLFNGGVSMGQYAPLTCSPTTQTAYVGQSVVVTASGGAGGYSWFTPENNLSGMTGSSVTVVYQSPGPRYVTVNAAGVSVNCQVNVISSGTVPGTTYYPVVTSGPVMCSPSTQTAAVGQTVTFSATGGDGTYTWSAPEVTLANPIGLNLQVHYATPGTRNITVYSAGQSSVCSLNVTGSVLGAYTYALPNTGGGGARFLFNR